LISQKRQIYDSKKYCQKDWQIFWKTVIFGNTCPFWHHLATLIKAAGFSQCMTTQTRFTACSYMTSQQSVGKKTAKSELARFPMFGSV